MNLINALEKIKDFDVLFFLPQNEDSLKIELCEYTNPGEQVGGNNMGKEYHIALFKCDDEGTYDHDLFDAILADPKTYISALIPQDWYGFVARKTTTSNEFVKETLDMIKAI
jgi:hypothetical protein